jgi:hypothetical protein
VRLLIEAILSSATATGFAPKLTILMKPVAHFTSRDE